MNVKLFKIYITVIVIGLTARLSYGNYANVDLVNYWDYGSVVAMEIDLDRHLAFIASDRSIHIINTLDHSPYSEIDSIQFSCPVLDLTYSQPYLFAALGKYGLVRINLSDPKYNQPAGILKDIPIFQCDAMDNYIYCISNNLSSGEAGLCIISFSSSGAATIVGKLFHSQLTEKNNSISILDQMVYVLNPIIGLWRIDITQPITPKTKDIIAIPGKMSTQYIHANTLYIAHDQELSMIDLSQNQVEKQTYSIPITHPTKISAEWPYIFVSDASFGLVVLDISKISSPVNAGYYQTNGIISDLKVFGESIFISDQNQGCFQLQFTGGKIVSDFTASPVQGKVPLTVHFKDFSKGKISHWQWDFGDGNFSDLQFPVHTYLTSGDYNITLKVSGKYGSDSETKPSFINVESSSEPFLANFEASPLTGLAPFNVSFTNTSLGMIDSYLWDFGDGQTSSDFQPKHTYQTPGIYTVRLVVKGPNNKNECIKNKLIHVFENKLTYVKTYPMYNARLIAIDRLHHLIFLCEERICYIFRASSYETLNQVYRIETEGIIEDIYIQDQTIYIAEGEIGVRWFDYSFPERTNEIGYLDVDGYATSIAVQSNQLWVGFKDQGLKVYDKHAFFIPRTIMQFSSQTTIYDILIHKQWIFAAAAESGVFIFNSTYLNKQLMPIYTITTSGQSKMIHMSPLGLSIADGITGAKLMDINFPEDPTIKQSWSSPLLLDTRYVGMNTAYFFAADGPHGLKMIDLSNNSKEKEMPSGIFNTTGNVNAFEIWDNYIYGVDSLNGLVILSFPVQQKANLHLSIPESINCLDKKTIGKVYIDHFLNDPLFISLTVDTPQCLTVPNQVIIPSGLTETVFDIVVVNKSINHKQPVRITATADGFISDNAVINIIPSKETLTVSKNQSNDLSIPDKCDTQNPVPVYSTIPITTPGLVEDITVLMSIYHKTASDLQISLISPDGQSVILIDQIKNEGSNFQQTQFNDHASHHISESKAPFTGIFLPFTPFNVIKGVSVAGKWQLQLIDMNRYDEGYLDNWQITIKYNPKLNDPPIARDDIWSTNRTNPIIIDVLKNDDDVNENPLHIFEIAQPQWGQAVIIHSSGSDAILYTPGKGFTSFDYVHYTITDQIDYASAKVEIQLSDIFNSNSQPIPIPDDDNKGITSTIFIPEYGTINDVNVHLTIMHPFTEDLTVELISPSQTRVQLLYKVGEDADNFINTILDDQADVFIRDGKPPYTGRYKPVFSLQPYNNEPLHGEWSLSVADNNNKDVGKLISWGMTIYFDAGEYTLNRSNQIGNQNSDLKVSKKMISQSEKNSTYFFIESIPGVGNRILPLTGRVKPMNGNDYKVVIAIYDSKWKIKPSRESFLTPIQLNGHWQCDITTEPGDHLTYLIKVLFVQSSDITLDLIDNYLFNEVRPRAIISEYVIQRKSCILRSVAIDHLDFTLNGSLSYIKGTIYPTYQKGEWLSVYACNSQKGCYNCPSSNLPVIAIHENNVWHCMANPQVKDGVADKLSIFLFETGQPIRINGDMTIPDQLYHDAKSWLEIQYYQY